MFKRNSPRVKGVITVFFTLLSVLFTALLCMLIESARVQGARAQTANLTELGNVSLFSEYEQKLLADFDVFGLDMAYGTADAHPDRVESRLTDFIQDNEKPAGSILGHSLAFDPWQIRLTDCSITSYALLSDGGGENFYQQAVAYMRETACLQAAGHLIRWYDQAQEAADRADAYKEAADNSDKDMEDLKKQEKAIKEEQEKAAKENAGTDGSAASQDEEKTKMKNPLTALRKIRKMSLLEIVCGSGEISSGSVARRDLASKRRLKKGKLKTKKLYSGLLNDVLFREYLLDHLYCRGDRPADGAENSAALSYGLEYVIAGKKSDKANLKSVVKKLLLVREGCNYKCCLETADMRACAGEIAELLIGWTGMPGLVAVLQHALLLGWAYGESLLDVRTLMMGGRVPLWKTESTWELKLENLGDLYDMLKGGRNDQSKGLNYREYLRILLNLQGISKQKKRGLDMVELSVKTGAGLADFQVDHCIVALKDETTWHIPPLFSRVTRLWIEAGDLNLQAEVKGGYSYMPDTA